MSLGEVANLVLSIANAGAVLVIISLGLAVMFGMMGVINFAHGEFLMLGAFTTLTLARSGVPLPIAMVAGALAVGVFGILVERVLIRWFYNRLESTMLVTFGLSLIMVQSATFIWGTRTLGIPTPLGKFDLGGYSISTYKLVLIAAAIGLLVLTWFVFTRTHIGLMARAATADPAMAAALGINARRINMYTFGFGATLAGAGGALLAPVVAVAPSMGAVYIPQAFMTVVIGGGWSGHRHRRRRGCSRHRLPHRVERSRPRPGSHRAALDRHRHPAAPADRHLRQAQEGSVMGTPTSNPKPQPASSASNAGTINPADAATSSSSATTSSRPSNADSLWSNLTGRVGLRTGILTVLAIVAALVVSGSAQDYQLAQWTTWLAFCVLAMSFTWVWGHGGIFSFAQAAFFGVGAYAYGAAGINLFPDTQETLSALVIGALAAVVLATAVGYFLFYGQVSGIYVAIVTLAVSLVFYTLVSSLSDPKYAIGDAAIGGFNGMVGIPPVILPGVEPLTVSGLFQFTAICAVLVATGLTLLRHSTFGRIVRAIEQNPGRARLLGYDVRRYNLLTFVIGGAVAGLAGALYAAWGAFVDPSVFGLRMATVLVIWVLVGGRTSILGAFAGVFAVEQLTTSITETGSTITPMVLGAVLIGVVMVVPAGLVPTATSLVRKARKQNPDRAEQRPRPIGPATLVTDLAKDETGKSVEVKDLVMTFGGVRAVNDLDLAFGSKGIRVLLGPNGAGKSTLFHMLVGNYRPTSGHVLLDGADVSRKRPDLRARKGMAIKLQKTSLFPDLNLHENVWLAAYGGTRNRADANAAADQVIDWLGYSPTDAHHLSAGAIAHGKQQWLDIAMALSTRPAVLLLDEPAAGMGREESTRVAELIRGLADDILVIVVEHDMQFVEELQAPVSVLHQGALLAEGALAEIRDNDEVLDVYLGRDTHAAR